MTINERIRNLRKLELKLSQTEFAKLIGIKQTTVSTFEQDGASVTEPVIKSICFAIKNLNEEWLRTGDGNMYNEPEILSLNDLAKEKGATSMDIAIVKAYFELKPSTRQELLDVFSNTILTQDDNLPNTPDELEKMFPPINQNDKSAS